MKNKNNNDKPKRKFFLLPNINQPVNTITSFVEFMESMRVKFQGAAIVDYNEFVNNIQKEINSFVNNLIHAGILLPGSKDDLIKFLIMTMRVEKPE